MNRIAPGFRIPKSVHVPLLAAAFGALLFTAVEATTAPLTEWVMNSYRDAPAAGEQPKETDDPAPPNAATVSRRARCKHCGIIESKRQVGGVHEITVRLADRSTYVFSDTSPANWRLGERIILIGGGNSPDR